MEMKGNDRELGESLSKQVKQSTGISAIVWVWACT